MRLPTSPRCLARTRPELDFVQLRRIAERFSEALQQCAWDFKHIGLLLGH
jgi:hypothetical protein